MLKTDLPSKAQTQNPVEPVEPAVFWSQMQWVMTAPKNSCAFRLELIIVSPCQFSGGHPTICPSGEMRLRHPLDDLARDHIVCFGWAVWTWFLRLLRWPTPEYYTLNYKGSGMPGLEGQPCKGLY